jgi:hypothetical protein
MQFQRVVTLGLAATMSLVLGATGAFAQASSSGSIAGVVRDTTGAVLPGVTVEAASPVLIEKTRSVVTDGSGAYKIVDLRPGTYAVTFTLTGFSTVKREGIELTTSFTANVNADMKVGSVEETITVSGASPIVDTQNVVQKQTASREVMDVLPTDRNFVSFAAMKPGVFVTGVSQNVGGSVPETGMNLVVHGSRAADSLIMVDGMSIINGSGSGGLQYGNYLNNSLAQEITFQTAGNSAEFERASVVSNFIPKEGSNSFRGSFQTRFTNQSLEANNLDATQISQGLKSANLVNKIWDLNPVGGGPIIKDRMWIYGGYRHWGTYNNVAGSFKDASFTETFYSCNQDAAGNCTTEQNLFPVWHQSAAARLTTQVAPKHKVNLYYDWQFTNFGNCFVPSLLTAISACPEYKNIPQYIVQGSWSSPVSNKLLLEAGGTLTAQDFHGFRQPGVPETQFQFNDQLAAAGQPSQWGSSNAYGANRSNQSNYRASASYVTGSHSTKVGMTLMHQWRYTTQEVNNSVTLTVRGKSPFSLTEYATPIQYHETVNYNMGLFAQDQWTLKRLTANYGLRMDFLKASVDPQDIAAGPFTPARHYDGVSNVPNWKDNQPPPRRGVRPVRERQDGAQGQLRPLRCRRRIHGGPCGQPRDHRSSSHDAELAGHHQLQSVPGLQPQEPAGEWIVRSDQQPGLRHLGRADDGLRSLGCAGLGRQAVQLGDAVQHPAAGGAARVGVRRLLAPFVRQPLRHQEQRGDERELHAVLHRRADGAVDHGRAAAERRRPAVRVLRPDPSDHTSPRRPVGRELRRPRGCV